MPWWAANLSEADLSAPGQYRPPRVVPRPGLEAQYVHTEVFRAGRRHRTARVVPGSLLAGSHGGRRRKP